MSDYDPGFYQSRGRGNKTGRVSPRDQVRGSARDLTLAAHGLIDAGAADPNQGQLFNADKVVGPRRTDEQIIKDKGLSMPTRISVAGKKELQYGAARGYLPNLSNNQKVAALQSVAEGRVKEGTDRGTGAPVAEIMEDRADVRGRGPGNVPWYMGVDDSGHHRADLPGEAKKAIDARAHRVGTGPAQMTRAAALTSPQSAWDINTPGSPDYRMPNLSHAEGVVRAVKGATSVEDAAERGSAVGTRDGGLPTMGAKAAAVHHSSPSTTKAPLTIQNIKSQKAPNFEASLRLSDSEVSVQRMAAQSYTVDRHDVRAAGVHDTMLNQRTGVYDVLAMTGARTAFKNRELPPNEQAREWVGQRGPNQHEGEHGGFFSPGLAGGKVQIRPEAMPPAREQLVANESRNQRRGRMHRDTAAEMGLEF